MALGLINSENLVFLLVSFLCIKQVVNAAVQPGSDSVQFGAAAAGVRRFLGVKSVTSYLRRHLCFLISFALFDKLTAGLKNPHPIPLCNH